jgi:hypothetical protein
VCEQALQHTGTPRAGADNGGPDVLRCTHGIQSIGM